MNLVQNFCSVVKIKVSLIKRKLIEIIQIIKVTTQCHQMIEKARIGNPKIKGHHRVGT